MPKKVLVTGASGEIGAAICFIFQSNGYSVTGVVSGRVKHQAIKGCDDLIECDLADLTAVEAIRERITSTYFDVLVNCAGINIVNPFLEIDSKEFQRIHNINLLAPFLFSQFVIPKMVEHLYGRIINIASIWSRFSRSGRASYSSSKFGLDGLTKALAIEFASSKILVNSVSPGFISTKLTESTLTGVDRERALAAVPIGRLGTAEEVAALVFWLGSDQNTFVTGQNYFIDGGFSCG